MRKSNKKSYKRTYKKSNNRNTKSNTKSNKILVRIPISKTDEFSKYGYSTKINFDDRKKALKKIVKVYTALSTFKRLNALAILTKNRSPRSSRAFLRDRNWVKKEYL